MAWQRVSVVVDGEVAEALADALATAGAVAVDTEDADFGTAQESARFAEPGSEVVPWPRARVSALFGEGHDGAGCIASALQENGVSALEAPRCEAVADTDWVRQTQAQFEPVRAGERLWVVPSWHAPPDPEAINIRIDPGAAFGTGTHPTTRLVLAWLERTVHGGETVIDYGCGSGVLAIAAMKLGASRATGVDVDPLSLEAARYNSRANDAALRCVLPGEPLEAADIMVANILANPLRVLAPLLAAHTRAGGALALSGILFHQAEDVLEAYAPFFSMRLAAEDAGWVCLAGIRRESA